MDKVRSINEILRDADASKDSLNKLEVLWNELEYNRKKYPLIHLKFAREHLLKLRDDNLEQGVIAINKYRDLLGL